MISMWLKIYTTNDFNWLKYFFCVCIYEMVVEITKETKKCGIKTVNHYNEKENIIELWQKMSDVETQTKHSNIAEVVLRRIRKYYGKKTKDITEKEKGTYKAYFEGEKGCFYYWKAYTGYNWAL